MHYARNRDTARRLQARDRWNPADGPPSSPCGLYTSRGWTEWTQGFQFAAPFLQWDATGEEHFLEMGRRATVERMAHHLTHVGVHDHGFNNISTQGTQCGAGVGDARPGTAMLSL